MIEQSFGLLFYLKKPTGFVKGEVPIYLRITVDGMSAELSTKRKCDPLRWNQHAERATGNEDAVKSINAYLDVLQEKMYEIKRRLIEHNKPITAITVRDILLGREDVHDKPRMLLEIFQHHNDQVAALVAKGMPQAPWNGTLPLLNIPGPLCNGSIKFQIWTSAGWTLNSYLNMNFG